MTGVATTSLVLATLFISCGSPFHPSRGDGRQHSVRASRGTIVFFVGTIVSRAGACPSAHLQVARAEDRNASSVQVVTGPDTVVSGKGGCAGLAPGARVEVEGNQAQDTVRADRIVVITD